MRDRPQRVDAAGPRARAAEIEMTPDERRRVVHILRRAERLELDPRRVAAALGCPDELLDEAGCVRPPDHEIGRTAEPGHDPAVR